MKNICTNAFLHSQLHIITPYNITSVSNIHQLSLPCSRGGLNQEDEYLLKVTSKIYHNQAQDFWHPFPHQAPVFFCRLLVQNHFCSTSKLYRQPHIIWGWEIFQPAVMEHFLGRWRRLTCSSSDTANEGHCWISPLLYPGQTWELSSPTEIAPPFQGFN